MKTDIDISHVHMAVIANASGLAVGRNMALLLAVAGLLTALVLSNIFLAKSSKHTLMVRKAVSG